MTHKELEDLASERADEIYGVGDDHLNVVSRLVYVLAFIQGYYQAKEEGKCH